MATHEVALHRHPSAERRAPSTRSAMIGDAVGNYGAILAAWLCRLI